MDTALFDYPLPDDRIAQTPAQRRDDSRLMLVDRATRTVRHLRFRDFPDLLPPHTRIFRNNAAVIHARLRAQRPTGGAVECLLLRPHVPQFHDGHVRPAPQGEEEWWCLLKPGRRLEPGATFEHPGAFVAVVREKSGEGPCRVAFRTHDAEALTAVAERVGEIPLPPYIRRNFPEAEKLLDLDRERYQTVYADPSRKVAAAAPTAGLHFTPEILADLARRGFQLHDLTLHVGLDTFRPIQSDTLEGHVIHREHYELPPETRAALSHPPKPGSPHGPRLAIGTTTLRAMEDYARQLHPPPPKQPYHGLAALFLHPPATFHAADALLTNFHLPRSTLVCLVSAFLAPGSTEGIAWFKELYAEAIREDYRFYSYGDAMLIL